MAKKKTKKDSTERDNSEPAKTRNRNYSFQQLKPNERTLLADAFLDEFMAQGTNKSASAKEKSELMKRVTTAWQTGIEEIKDSIEGKRYEKLKEKEWQPKNINDVLQHLANENMVKFSPRSNYDLIHNIRQKLKNSADVEVAGAVFGPTFYRVAAKEFVTAVERVAGKLLAQSLPKLPATPDSQTPTNDQPEHDLKALNIGIVSGSTIANTIDALEEADWAKDFGVNLDCLKRFEKINLIALNVCLTQGRELSQNATVLSYRLAKKFSELLSKTGARTKINPMGLTGPLVVTEDEMKNADNQPETVDLLRITQPSRVPKLKNPADSDSETKNPADSQPKNPADSDLHIVLTSVGAAEKSLFDKLKEYLRDRKADISELGSMAGDICYTPVTRNGQEIEVRDKDNKKIGFYRAIDLSVLREMAKSPTKRVILISRFDEERDKSGAIRAAIGNAKNRYANQLIIDERLAQKILGDL